MTFPPSRPRLLALALAALLLGALLLRVATIGQSLPYVDHPDEPNPIDYVVGMLRTGDPNQQFFQKPSLFVFLLLAGIQAHYAWGLAAGIYGDIAQMVVTTHTVTTVPGFFLVARWISAIFGALTVLAAYSLGVRGWSRAAGLAGAVFVAVLPYHLRFSQWATTDVTASFLTTLSLGAALLALRTGRWSAYLVAGAFAGLAASTKYNAGAVACALIVVTLIRALRLNVDDSQPNDDGRRTKISAPQTTDDGLRTTDYRLRFELLPNGDGRRTKVSDLQTTVYGLRSTVYRLQSELLRLAGAGLAAIACFIAGTPYVLLSWGQVGGGIARQWGNYGGANGHYRGAWNIGGYAEFFAGEGLGLAGCLAVLAGLLILARRRPLVLAVWLGFALPSLLVHLSRPTHFMQNMLPLLVACALPVGVAVAEGGRLIETHLLRRLLSSNSNSRISWLVPTVSALLLATVALPALALSLAYVGRQAAGDARVQLLDWISHELPPGTRIAVELKPVPGPTEARWTDVPRLDAYDLAWYRAQGYAYLVASSKRWGQVELPASYAELAGAGPVADFGPRRHEEMLGPRLLVFNTGLSPADAPLPIDGELLVGGARLAGVTLGDPSGDGAPPMLVSTTEFRAGGVLGLRTFWEVREPFAQDYFIFVHLIDANGGRPTQRDAPPWQGRFPTSSWRPGTLVVDANDVYLPPGLPPGQYRVIIGMYDPATFARPPMTLNGAPVPEGAVEVAQITITQ